LPETIETLPKNYAANNMCPSLLVFTQLFFESPKPARKQNLTRNSHSVSFKVRYFGIIEKLTTDCVSLRNNAGLISKVSEEIAGETMKIAVLDNSTVV